MVRAPARSPFRSASRRDFRTWRPAGALPRPSATLRARYAMRLIPDPPPGRPRSCPAGPSCPRGPVRALRRSLRPGRDRPMPVSAPWRRRPPPRCCREGAPPRRAAPQPRRRLGPTPRQGPVRQVRQARRVTGPGRPRAGRPSSCLAGAPPSAPGSNSAKRPPPGDWRPGVATLRLRIRSDGALLEVAVLRSSGSAALDSAALGTVRRAAPFPPAPDEAAPSVAFDLPVTFR